MAKAIAQSIDKVKTLQTLKKPASQGSQIANKGAYLHISDRNMQLQLTMKAKISTIFNSIRGIFAFAGFVSRLSDGKSHRF